MWDAFTLHVAVIYSFSLLFVILLWIHNGFIFPFCFWWTLDSLQCGSIIQNCAAYILRLVFSCTYTQISLAIWLRVKLLCDKICEPSTDLKISKLFSKAGHLIAQSMGGGAENTMTPSALCKRKPLKRKMNWQFFGSANLFSHHHFWRIIPIVPHFANSWNFNFCDSGEHIIMLHYVFPLHFYGYK